MAWLNGHLESDAENVDRSSSVVRATFAADAARGASRQIEIGAVPSSPEAMRRYSPDEGAIVPSSKRAGGGGGGGGGEGEEQSVQQQLEDLRALLEQMERGRKPEAHVARRRSSFSRCACHPPPHTHTHAHTNPLGTHPTHQSSHTHLLNHTPRDAPTIAC